MVRKTSIQGGVRILDRRIMIPVLLICLSAGISAETFAQNRQPGTRGSGTKGQQLGLNGYCPVCIIEMKKWMKGNPLFASRFDGKIYYFPSAQIKAKFDANPAKYVPALGGDCTVCLAKMGKRMPGSVQQAAFHQNRLYLFPSEQQKKMFLAEPAKFANVDLALGGLCSVCKIEMKKDVPGKPEYTVIYQGMRYQFPGEQQMKMFQANPAKYAVKGPQGSGSRGSGKRPATGNPSAQFVPQAKPINQNIVSITGTSTCAGCEHGVAPLGAPEELGLAVDAKDGKVYVIEDAHQRYPKLYDKRFEQLPVQVSGVVIKEKDNVRWLKATELKMLN